MKTSQASAVAPAARILLVDDNRNGLKVRKTLLEEQGYVITIADCPEAGLHQFESHSFDMVITDYRMPKMDGVQLIAKIRALKPGIPVVLVSGVAEQLGLNEANTGADAVVAKTNNEPANLLRAVTRLLKKKPAASQTVTARKRKSV
jgi:CheY-like chemotaxis protein